MTSGTANKKGLAATNDQTPDTNQPAESESVPGSLQTAECDRFETLRARAALHGSSLFELSGGYLLTRYCATRALPDLAAVAALLAQLGVR